jgi:hypothetical protein
MRARSILTILGVSALLIAPLGAMAQSSPTGPTAIVAAQGSVGGGTTAGTDGFRSASRSDNPVGAAVAGMAAGGGTGTSGTTGTTGSTSTAGTKGTTGR